jgi:hypothetical protein
MIEKLLRKNSRGKKKSSVWNISIHHIYPYLCLYLYGFKHLKDDFEWLVNEFDLLVDEIHLLV